MTRLVRTVLVLLAGLAASAAAAAPLAESRAPGAATPDPVALLDTTVTTGGGAAASCLDGLRDAGGAVAVREVTVDRGGYLFATLRAASGDWDLAVYGSQGRVSGGASSGGHEVASGFVDPGTYTLQACRRSGGASKAALAADFTPLPADAKPEKVQLVDVHTPTRAAKDRLVALGVDLTEHGHEGSLGVVLHGADDARRLRRAGFTWDVEVADVAARTLRDRTADRRFAASVRASDLPSGRDEYRKLEDYENEMKALAAAHPGLVRLFELPHKTWEGRTVMGIEVTTDVNVADGKPAFLNMGVHHAREWPSGEHAMEWAYELINGFKSGDPRATNIVRKSRNIVVPVVNPDGFNASRTAGSLGGADGGRDESVPDTVYLVGGGATGGEYRRKNCRAPDDSERGTCATSFGLLEPGVDPNRNYGGLWGGPGADPSNPFTQTYRGPDPFSEPETRNVKWLVGTNQVTTLITNHTTAGLVLRAPGLAALGDPVDENRGYKALGDELALHNGYFSQKSFELYDTTGTTEDWTYNTAGGFGFTFEIYCGRPNYATGDCNDPAFHPRFQTMVDEWTGESAQADHENDPGHSAATPYGTQPGFDGKGNREAYYIAAESTLNEERHSVIEGEAPAGATLRISKQFKTETFPQPQEDGSEAPIVFDDALESVLEVGESGAFRWHTNPSTRPIVAKDRGDQGGGEPAEPETQRGGINGTTHDPNDDRSAAPFGDAEEDDPLFNNEHHITVPATGDNRSANIRVHWSTPTTDWDVKLYENVNGNDDVDAGDREVGVSQQGATSEEEVGITGSPRLEAGKKYILRVTNFAAVEPYEVDITWNGPEPFQPGRVESWTLTCSVGGEVLQTTQVQVDRGQVARPDLSQCRRAAASAQGHGQGQGAAQTADSAKPCTPIRGLRSATARGDGRRVALRFRRTQARPVTVDVFQQSVGRNVIGERLVARYRNRSSSFRWNGRANRPGRKVTDGWYFVRYRMRTPEGTDTRRVTLRRVGGKFTRRPAFYRRNTCGLLQSYKLTRPVFGGRTNREVGIAYRLGRSARVTVTVTKGERTVERYATIRRAGGRTFRLRLDSERRPRGVYKVHIVARRGNTTVRRTLTTHRL